MVRVTAGVEAHTHEYIATAHEDQKFGFSITSGDALEAVRRVVAAPGLELLGLHSHIGSQIFDTSGFEVAARRVLALHAQVGSEVGVTMPELDLGGGFGIAYTTQDDPSDPAQLAIEMSKIVEHECRALGIARAAPVDRARPRDRRPGDVHRLHRRHRQAGRARRGSGAHLRQRRRRHERQHPHRPLRRRLLLHPRLAGLGRAAGAGPRRRQALRGRRHRGQGRVPARRRPPGRPASPSPPPAPTVARWPPTTTTRCVRRWSRCGTASPRRSSDARLWTTCWPPTWERTT